MVAAVTTRFYDELLALVEASRDRQELNDPARANALICSGLAVIDGYAIRDHGADCNREDFLSICGMAWDKARGIKTIGTPRARAHGGDIEIVEAPGDRCGNTRRLPDGSPCPGCRACR
jgi:hypothetical protein